MYVTLSILFLILLLFFVIYGWGIIMRRSGDSDSGGGEKCSICRERYPKDVLVEREIGDFKLMYFCGACINSLHNDAKRLHKPAHQ